MFKRKPCALSRMQCYIKLDFIDINEDLVVNHITHSKVLANNIFHFCGILEKLPKISFGAN